MHVYVDYVAKNYLYEVLPIENLPLVQSTGDSLSLTTEKELIMPDNLSRERKLAAFYWRNGEEFHGLIGR